MSYDMNNTAGDRQRDWNDAKVGPPDTYEHWTGTVRRFGAGETNERGERLLELRLYVETLGTSKGTLCLS